MILLNSDKEKVSIEMSRQEFFDIFDIVATANSCYEWLDAFPYRLTEERVSLCNEKIAHILGEINKKTII